MVDYADQRAKLIGKPTKTVLGEEHGFKQAAPTVSTLMKRATIIESSNKVT